MSVASEQAALARQPIRMLRLIMDQCENTYGVPPCFAIFNETDADEVVIQATRTFPSMIQIANGDLICAYVTAADDIKCKISSDLGDTWGSEITIYSTADTNIHPFLLENGVGDVLCFFDTNEDGFKDLKVLTSADDGDTWGGKKTVYAGAGFDSEPTAILKSDGDILCAFSTNEDGNYDIKALTSTDDGDTWGGKVTVYAGAGFEWEPSLELLGNDNDIICAFGTFEDGTFNLKTVISADGGGTWGAKTDLYATAAANRSASLIYAPGGFLICAFDTNEDGDADVKSLVSIDNGANWSDIVLLLDSGDIDTAPSLALLADGSIKCALVDSGDVAIINVWNISTPCYYTFPTCKDPDNYVKGSFDWDFSNRGAPYLPGVYPYLMEPIKHTATLINQDKFKTERGVMQFKLQEDDAWPLANPNKTIGNSDNGRFWRNWIARMPNYHGRIAELFGGYAGVAKDAFELRWRGRIDTIDFTKDGIEIRVIDLLFKAAEEKYPNKISDNNTVRDDPLAQGAGTVTVNDVSEFFIATANEPRHIKIEDEIIEYADQGAGPPHTLLDCTRGAHLTTAIAHDQDKKIKQIMIHAQPGFTREPADHIFMDILCNLAGIDAALYIETTDVGLTIDDAGGITAGDTTIGVSNTALLPFEGIALIENEMVRYGNVSGNNLIECKRGMYGTKAAGHADSVDVKPTTFTHEIGKWLQGGDFNTHVESPKAVKKFITDLQMSVMCDIFPNEAGKIECIMQAPPIGEPVTAYINADMIGNTRGVGRDEDSRITRVAAYYKQNEINPGTDPLKFDGLKKHIDAPAESADSFNEVREKIFYLPFTFTEAGASRLVDRYFQRWREGCPIVSFSLELKDDDTEVGDIVSITVPEIVDQTGATKTRLYRVIKKLQVGLSTLKYMARDAGFGTNKYRLIGPKNGILDAGINDSTTQIDVDLSGTDLEHADWRTGGVHHIYIGDEKISYTTATDLGGDVTRLTGGARGVDGTANVVHAGGVDVRRLFSACADADRDKYGFIGTAGSAPDGNLLDGNGDLVAETEGILIY